MFKESMLSPSFGKVVYIKIISLKPRQNKENKNNPSFWTGCFMAEMVGFPLASLVGLLPPSQNPSPSA
jgi:hypothetical protein